MIKEAAPIGCPSLLYKDFILFYFTKKRERCQQIKIPLRGCIRMSGQEKRTPYLPLATGARRKPNILFYWGNSLFFTRKGSPIVPFLLHIRIRGQIKYYFSIFYSILGICCVFLHISHEKEKAFSISVHFDNPLFFFLQTKKKYPLKLQFPKIFCFTQR